MERFTIDFALHHEVETWNLPHFIVHIALELVYLWDLPCFIFHAFLTRLDVEFTTFCFPSLIFNSKISMFWRVF